MKTNKRLTTSTFCKNVMLNIQTILQKKKKKLQTANVVSDYW